LPPFTPQLLAVKVRNFAQLETKPVAQLSVRFPAQLLWALAWRQESPAWLWADGFLAEPEQLQAA
jgi:hypothetical protein